MKLAGRIAPPLFVEGTYHRGLAADRRRDSSRSAASRLLDAMADPAPGRGRGQSRSPGRYEARAMTGVKIRESDRWKHRRKPQPCTAADQARIDKWIRDRLIDWRDRLAMSQADRRRPALDRRLQRRSLGALSSRLPQRMAGAAGSARLGGAGARSRMNSSSAGAFARPGSISCSRPVARMATALSGVW
jgi:hypothetical protein